MPHHDLDSLTFLSSDIVIAQVHKMLGQQDYSDARFVVTVERAVYGTLRAGDKLEMLSEFLTFYEPMEDGQRVVLFLDARQHKPYLLFPEASKSPFAMVPSGVYLVDAYGHVHEYYQQSNPGPYVARGYELGSPTSIPSREKDLALPSLSEVEKRILNSLTVTRPMRKLVDTATIHDASALIDLLKARAAGSDGCGWLVGDAIVEAIAARCLPFNDPELILRTFSLYENPRLAIGFVGPLGGDKKFTRERVRYLIQTLSDSSADLPLRMAAVEMVFFLSGFHDGPPRTAGGADPIDVEWLASSAPEIRGAAKKVFEDVSEDGHLRAKCVQLLRVDQPETIADMKKVYAASNLGLLRFAIEESFLSLSDDLYLSLKPPGGPVASIVRVTTEDDCVRASAGNIAFIAEDDETLTFAERIGAVAFSSHGQRVPQKEYFVLTDARTEEQVLLIEARPTGGSAQKQEAWTELERSTKLPPGEYHLAVEYTWEDKVVSRGYGLPISVVETPAGRTLVPH